MHVLMARSPGDSLLSPRQWPVAVDADRTKLEAIAVDLSKQADSARATLPWWAQGSVADQYLIEDIGG